MAKKKSIETTPDDSGVVDSKLKSKAEIQDSLSLSIVESLNKKFSKEYEKVAYYLDGSEETPSDLNDWVSTGSDVLDIAISNRPNGGLPSARILEFFGWEASGKSLISGHIMADTQRKGGLPVYIDTENSLNVEFLSAIGVDTDPKKFVYIQLALVEEIFEAIENIISKVRESSKKRLVTIIVDSIAAASTKVEMESDYDKDGWSTAKAIIMSKGLRKIKQLIANENILLIFNNQLRDKLGVMFGDKSTTGGGKALQFYASARLKIAQIGQIKIGPKGKEEVIGARTEVKVIKNRFGPPHRKAIFNIYFDSGIDNLGSWIETMSDRGLIDGSGSNYTWVDKETAEVVKFTKKTFKPLLLERPEIKAGMYKDICDSMIMKYKKNDSSLESSNMNEPNYDTDEIEIDNGSAGDE
jgi:recombination protein RecA